MEFKVGETYALELAQGFYRPVKVERITPTGRIVAGGRTFNSDGWERTGKNWYDRRQLLPMTDEIRDQFERYTLASKIATLGTSTFNRLTLDQLRRIRDILKEERVSV